MHLWISLFGDSTTSLRFPSILAMSGAAALLALLGRRLFGAPAGLIAGLIFALTPSMSRFAQEARPYAFAVLAAVASTLLLLRALDRPVWWRWAAYSAALVFTGISHIVAITVLAAHVLVAVWPVRGEGRWARPAGWAASVAAALACLSPLLYIGSQQTGPISWIKYSRWAYDTLPFYLAGSYDVANLIKRAALVGGIALLVANRRALALLVAWIAVPPLFCAVTSAQLHLFLARYFLFTVPAWCLLAGAGVYAVSRLVSARPEFRWSQMVLAAAAVLMFAHTAMPAQTQVRRQQNPGQPDYLAAAQALIAHAHSGEAIAYSGPINSRIPMDHELPGSLRLKDVFLARSAAALGQLYATECADSARCLGATPKLWLVSTSPKSQPFERMPPDRAALLREKYTITSQAYQMQQIRVVLLVRK
jgi:mannosyltransferase